MRVRRVALGAWIGTFGIALVAAPGGAEVRRPVTDPAGSVSGAFLSLQQPPPDDLEDLAANATKAVVLIEVKAGDDARQGSGFLVDPSGLILTNHHVVRGATSAVVRLSSGDVYEQVALLATDERRDLAVLRIPGFGLPALEMGNSDSVRIGSTAIAIGSPLGLENTVSTGIVSGRRQEPEGYQLIQITAPASSGSSGGPVLARDGRVIGIAAAQLRSGQNLNFAVPINYARGLLSQLGSEPLEVLTAVPSASEAKAAVEMSTTAGRVNGGLRFDLGELEGYRLDLEATGVGGTIRTTRITLRSIEDVAGGERRLERYVDSETTMPRGSLGPPLTIRRERTRTIVSASDLHPLTTRGQTDFQADGEWRQTAYDLRFEEGRVRGIIRDTAGIINQVDRAVPEGILAREMREIAFGSLVADRLTGRSVEFVTLDPWTGQVMSDRFDVQSRTDIEIGGRTYEALVVDVASGLVNERAYFSASVPRTLLKRVNSDAGEVEEVQAFFLLPGPDGDP